MDRRHLLQTLAIGLPAALFLARGARASVNRYYDGPVSDHFDGRRFFNPAPETPRGPGGLLRWKLAGRRARWPKRWPDPPAQARPAGRVAQRDLVVTMVGHATLLVQAGGLNILTDPVWSERASPTALAGPRRLNAPGIRFEDLPRIDLVLLSHNHYDHLDAVTLRRLRAAHDPLVVTPLGNDTIVRQIAPDMRVVALDWGQSVEAGAATLHCEPAQHWSARGLDDRRMALWGAFAVETPAGRLYHVGDTGFGEGHHYEAARRRHGAFRLAILPIGAYEPRWFMRPVHQNPAEAVRGFALCGAQHAVAHHWGTFQLTDEGLFDPPNALGVALDEAGLARDRFRVLAPGASWRVPN